MNRLKIAVIALVATIGLAIGFGALQQASTASASAASCGGANNIVPCGVPTPSQLKSTYAANKDGLQAIYSHYNITASDIANSASAKTGYVTPDQKIIVDGKVIATNAITVGRTSLSGSPVKIGSVTVYQGPRTFNTTQAVYVFYNADGSFRSAVMKVCGNPVPATPVPVPKPPVYACSNLTAIEITRNQYQFTTTATAQNGATIKSYTYNFGDSTSATNGARVSHTYAGSGTFTARVTVQVAVNNTVQNVTSNSCVAVVTVAPELAQACNVSTGVIESVNKTLIDNVHYTTDLSQCSKVKYCDTATKTYITVLPSQKKSTYTTDYSQCQVTVCDTSTNTIVTIDNSIVQQDTTGRYTTDQSKCAPSAPAVTTYPHTGPMDILGSGIGAGALSLAGYYYYISRRIV